MKNFRKHLPTMLSIAFALAFFNVVVLGQSRDDKNFASLSGMGSSVRFDVGTPHAAVTLTVIGPDGVTFSKEFQSGNAPEFLLTQAKGERLPDGEYTYELRVSPNISAETKEALRAARAKGNGAEVQRELRKRGALPAQQQVQSGSFHVINGSVITAGAMEEGVKTARAINAPATPAVAVSSTGRTNFKVQRHHPRFMFFDQVIPDDLIVQGSICAGFDCVNNENFGFDTLRLKENNTRIQFDDTSSSAGFATNNWQIRANDSPSGGANFLGIVDQGATGTSDTGTIVFAVSSGALANSLRVGSNSKIGLRTATPVLDVHANTTDTPAIRLEQNNTGGFTAQTWDIGANEANFFVRDVTAGSRLSFRIRPGAPTSSLDISADGDIGVGTGSPATRLDVRSADTATASVMGVANSDATRFLSLYSGNNNGAALIWDSTQALRFGNGDIAGAVTFTEWARFTNAGRLGIGTTTPDSPLTVNGNASKPGGGSWNVFSDIRLKNVRGTFNTGLKAVMQLQPLRYEYRSNNALGIVNGGEHIGFSAQEVQKVIPQAVTQTEGGFLMVNNDPIILTMLNAIKEQQKEIVELKKQIRQLRNTRRRK